MWRSGLPVNIAKVVYDSSLLQLSGTLEKHARFLQLIRPSER